MVDFFYRGPDKETALDRLQRAPVIAVDTETVSLNDLTAIGIGAYWADDEGAYFPCFPLQVQGLEVVLNKCADKETTKIYHNGLGFDLEVLDALVEEGWPPPDDTNIEDTSIMAQVCGLPPGLQHLGEDWLGANDLFSIQDLFRVHVTRNMLGVPTEATATKCLNDCRTTWQLYQSLSGADTRTGANRLAPLSERQWDCYSVDRKLISILRAMSRKGLGLRQGILQEHKRRLERDIHSLECELDAAGISKPGSPACVGHVLATRGNNLLRRVGGQWKMSTAEDILEELDDPLAKTVLEWRGAKKLLSTYVTPWLGRERAHTHFRLDLSTGRLASGRINGWDSVNRNLQNIPPDMREIFAPDSGIWTWADHSQLELRIIAHMSGDPVMQDAYRNNKDLHAITAQAAGISRSMGKTANFADAFGGGDKKLAKVLGVTVDRAREIKRAKDETYSVAERWKRELMNDYGQYATTLFGRDCRLPDRESNPLWLSWSDRKWASHLGSCNVNFRVQGTGADILKRGILLLHEAGLDERLSIHDEHLLSGGPVELPDLEHIHPELATPVEVKRGLVWS